LTLILPAPDVGLARGSKTEPDARWPRSRSRISRFTPAKRGARGDDEWASPSQENARASSVFTGRSDKQNDEL